MANTINDLYLKYVDGIGSTLESDRYFQYLFEMVQAGSNTLAQSRQVLHKVVDERWLTTIEESLDAINNIIDKPRRFVTTNEEVVPVALAKKISAESVRHLSMNTQFIASSENGDIQPTRILNVSTEESYDLYENRFIYHLIQRLVTFIDKRTDVIFWSTGDEKRNRLSMESKVEDGYEEIQYKIEMTIKNRQSFAENDSDNMDVFMRIDRVRRLVMALRGSAFCSLMAGCSKVHSPIQRTNLMMKDPNYRTCYKLWQFLESYDEVGYSIEEINTSMEFDEEYLFQLYTNLITNYTVFKSLMESDLRNVEEIGEPRKVIKPKFIKKIIEQEVDDYNLPDVEIKRVFVEEVTERQLELEKLLEEETARRKTEEEAREDAEIRAQQASWELKSLQQQRAEEQTRAEQELEQVKNAAAKELEETKAGAAKELAEVKAEAAKELEEARAEAAQELEKTRAEAAQELEETRAEAAQELEETRAEAAKKLEETREEAAKKLAAAAKELEETRTEAAQELEDVISEAAQMLNETRDEADRKLAEVKTGAEKELAETRNEAARKIAELKINSEKELAETREKAARELEAAREEAAEVRRRLEEKEAVLQQILESQRLVKQQREADRQERRQLSRFQGDPEENLGNMIENLSRRNRTASRGRKGKK